MKGRGRARLHGKKPEGQTHPHGWTHLPQNGGEDAQTLSLLHVPGDDKPRLAKLAPSEDGLMDLSSEN